MPPVDSLSPNTCCGLRKTHWLLPPQSSSPFSAPPGHLVLPSCLCVPQRRGWWPNDYSNSSVKQRAGWKRALGGVPFLARSSNADFSFFFFAFVFTPLNSVRLKFSPMARHEITATHFAPLSSPHGPGFAWSLLNETDVGECLENVSSEQELKFEELMEQRWANG